VLLGFICERRFLSKHEKMYLETKIIFLLLNQFKRFICELCTFEKHQPKMRGNVYFIDTVHPVLQERLSLFGYKCVDLTKVRSVELLPRILDAKGLVIRSRITLSSEILSQLTDLQFVARSGSGLENIDVSFCNQHNIQLFNSPEGNRNAVAEHALGMLLALFNNIVKSNNEIRKGIWDREGNRGIELDGKTIGIIGYGNNGAAFAKKLRGFDVKVMAFDKYKTGFGDHFVQECTLKAIQEQADVISFHIPQNKETIHFFNDDFLLKCTRNIYLLNLSRGKIVDTKSLVSGLKSDRIKGACLDVLEYEKSSFESFFDQEHSEEFGYLLESNRVLLSPHIAGWTNESYFKLSDVLADKIISYFSV
jgi:D-3-phosphoglycerate dehydrogenase